jgi:hypothetical protein
LESTITIKLTDSPIDSIFNLHKTVFDFSFTMLEFYSKKLDEAKESGDLSEDEMEHLKTTTVLWAVSANILRAPVMGIVARNSEMMQELSAFSKNFADKASNAAMETLLN